MGPEQQSLNLIRVFDFYLALMFAVSLARRWRVYWNALRLLVAVRGRWPKLIEVLGQHRSVLMNWSFFRPALVAFALMVIQLVVSRLLFPQAVLTVGQLRQEWWLIPVILIALAPMLAVDLYFILRVGRFDHDETVKYFDQAESWLGWKGPVLRALTLGIVNPRKMVADEVRRNLEEMRSTLTASLWWVIAQTALRLAFGFTLWTVWAIHG